MTGASDNALKATRLCLLALYAIGVEWICIKSGDPADPWWWVIDVPFFLWIVAPVATPLLLRLNSWFLAAGAGAMAAHGLYVYATDMFGPGARSTSALIFIFLPLYQWVGAAVLIVSAFLLPRKTIS